MHSDQQQIFGGLYSSTFEHDNCGFGLLVNKYGNKSHRIIGTAVKALSNMKHRGAVSADGLSGDGCGVLFKIDAGYFWAKAESHGFKRQDKLGTGLVFFAPDKVDSQRQSVEEIVKKYGLIFSGLALVNIDKSYLGEQAKAICPDIYQLFVGCGREMCSMILEEKLYLIRRELERIYQGCDYFYLPSLSSRTIVYKGLVTPENLPRFYPDLADLKLTTDLCIFHQRFSTNTLPQWRLAQPFRYLAHNGEINTIKGNRNWVNANGSRLLDKLKAYQDIILPITNDKVSDSCSVDHVVECLHLNGMSLLQTLRIMIPPAWQNQEDMDADLRAFYEFYGMHMGAWDGPTALVATDGRFGLCILDRNGLRPARWHENIKGDIMIASEAGVYDDSLVIVKKGRVRPGQMIAVDTESGAFLSAETIDNKHKHQLPYKQWLNSSSVAIRRGLTQINQEEYSSEVLTRYLHAFDVHYEEREVVIKALATDASEAIGSMGDDTPIAVLSKYNRPLYDFFRQQFAQVTNPPIDSLRESVVMSLKTFIGKLGNLHKPSPELATRVLLESPILSPSTHAKLMKITSNRLVISLNYPEHTTLPEALDDIKQQVLQALDQGCFMLILDDSGIKENNYSVHALLATGFIHHQLSKLNRRCEANIIVVTATARDPHQFTCLLAYGATAIYPYLSYQLINHMVNSNGIAVKDKAQARRNYRLGINKGLRKIMSKMGISTMTSYRGAQLFEIIGLADEVVTSCFYGTPSRLSGLDFNALKQRFVMQMKEAFICNASLPKPKGRYKFTLNGEYHAFNPEVVLSLQKAINNHDVESYQNYRDLVNNRGYQSLRDLLAIKVNREVKPIDIDEVMPLSEIYQCFDSAGMSLGAISPEAHEAMAMAMNELGGRSNSGEGGEAKERYHTNKVSKIKQIASGRFGVTPEYLVNAEVIQIKIAQGAKPGEGGQLPGKKVNDLIAKLRFSVPGVTLISPPPHHDIYSIEDLAELIFDLKQINPEAFISVKLVSEAGVGTIAAGVVKAYADMITISGHDGGTGASPLSSIVYAGTPWEIGLAETQQTLVKNNLRGKIKLQVDGGLKTGLDIVKAAILGAESFAFGTAPMIALGCKYLRICHLNNCATGVATQDELLRDKYFRGTVDKLKCFFTFLATDVRECLAKLGVKRLNDLIGRVDLLEIVEAAQSQYGLDLQPIVYQEMTDYANYYQGDKNQPFDSAPLAHAILATTKADILAQNGGNYQFEIRNTDRAIGAMLSGFIAKIYGNAGLENPLNLYFKGTSGQSFGAFGINGLHLHLIGEANDYVGKSMAGGEIVIIPPAEALFEPALSPIIGNTCLYGATGGKLFAYGQAGERFAVRNSGAIAVVEGAGDHCCEYMTGGVIIVLGETGINFGAGMTGGVAFVFDRDNTFSSRYNNEFIKLYRIQSERMQDYQELLYSLIQTYFDKTCSDLAKEILTDFHGYLRYFWMVATEATFENCDVLVTQYQISQTKQTNQTNQISQRGQESREDLTAAFNRREYGAAKF
ncbi:glutamate synthase large subunit [Cysteiniphilum sp. 6C5]|uniref:glutamate synthase large subunit n=1 Tax=unclassified Cysteiniphilum TaxID=2610889 RepID=UPI003F82A7E1